MFNPGPIADTRSSPYDLSAQEREALDSTRAKCLAMAIAGFLCTLTSFLTWVGTVAGLASALAGIVGRQRCHDGHTVYHGKNGMCCCCSTPWSQLDACCSASISGCAFAVVCVIVDLALIFTGEIEPGSTWGIVAIVNAIFAIATAVSAGMGTSALRRVIREVYYRIDASVSDVAPSNVISGVIVTAIPERQNDTYYGEQQQQQQQQQQQHQVAYGPSGYNAAAYGNNASYNQQQQPGYENGAPPQKSVV